MKECLLCRQIYEDKEEQCKIDSSPLKETIEGNLIIAGCYRLEERLLDNGLEIIYKAKVINHSKLQTNTEVIVKIIPKDIVQYSPKIPIIFSNTAETMKTIQNDFILKVYDYGQSEYGYLYAVTEIPPKITVKSLIEKEELEIDRAINLMKKICEALSYMHKRSLLNKDLKSTKIYIYINSVGEEKIKIGDFWLGSIKEEIFKIEPTMKEEIFELPYYQSPEYFKGEPIRIPAEIYSLGVVFYEMVTGTLPFQASTYLKLKDQHLFTTPTSIWALRRETPEQVEEIIQLMLSKSPRQRIPSAEAVQEALRRVNLLVLQMARSEAEIQALSSFTLMNMPAVSANAIYSQDLEDYMTELDLAFDSIHPDLSNDNLEVEEKNYQVAAKVIETSTEITPQKRKLITIGSMIGMLLAAMEVTVVSTAMPKVVADLGGFAIYSWTFSIYLLTSTVGVPVWGKLSDLYGRRICYQVGLGIFILGSILCGLAESMQALIFYRAIQGLGGGALAPLALTVVGDLYTLEERPKMQAVMSGVWGAAAILGPLIGGIITDYSTWRWIFFINVPISLISLVIISLNMPIRKQTIKPKIDVAGTIALTIAISLLLLACVREGQTQTIPAWVIKGSLVGALIFIGLFIYIEKKAIEPLLPLWLFREKVFLATVLGNLFAGAAILGSMPFVTLFSQRVLNTSATQAGTSLIPLVLGWVALSIVGAKIMLKVGFRKAVMAGMTSMLVGFTILSFLNMSSSKLHIYVGMAVVGMGMGLGLTSLLVAVQTSVPKTQLGVVTSLAIFSRNIGGSLGATLMGVIMSIGTINLLKAAPTSLMQSKSSGEIVSIINNLNIALDPKVQVNLSSNVLEYFRVSLAEGIHLVFVFCVFIALCGFGSSLLLPSQKQANQK